MVSSKCAKLINILPDKMGAVLSRKIVDLYLDKYANIAVDGIENLENIIKPTILVCNHLSNADGIVLDKCLKLIDPTFVAGVKLSENTVTNMGIKIIKTTSIKPDSADVKGIKKAVELINSGENLLIFPEGTRSRSSKLIEAKKGILLIARMTGAPIIPIGIVGTEKLLPINDVDMGAELLNYADVRVNIGKQFRVTERDKHQSKREYESVCIDLIMGRIAELLPIEYRGHYR